MDVLGPRIFHDGPVLSSGRWLPGRFKFSKLATRLDTSHCYLELSYGLCGSCLGIRNAGIRAQDGIHLINGTGMPGIRVTSPASLAWR